MRQEKMNMKHAGIILVLIMALALSACGTTEASEGELAGSSVTDGRFIVTLEEVISAEDRALFAYSVEAVTEEAKAEFWDGTFNESVYIKLPDDPEVEYWVEVVNEMGALRTDAKRYYMCQIHMLENPNNLPLAFCLNYIADGENYIELPMDTCKEAQKFTLTDPSGNSTTVEISPLDIIVDKELPDGYDDFTFNMDMFFRMRDGSVMTFSQLFKVHSAGESDDMDFYSDVMRFNYQADAREIWDLSQFKSIIVGGMEYDLSDPTQVSEAELDERMKPFAAQMKEYDGQELVLVKENLEQMGGEIIVDREAGRAVAQYRGVTTEFFEGEDYILKDGVTVTPDSVVTTIAWNEEELLLSRYAFQVAFGVQIDVGHRNADGAADVWNIIP